jgi:hypothetical protein
VDVICNGVTCERSLSQELQKRARCVYVLWGQDDTDDVRICDGAQADMRAGGREAVSRKQRQRVGGDYECLRGLSECESLA